MSTQKKKPIGYRPCLLEPRGIDMPGSSSLTVSTRGCQRGHVNGHVHRHERRLVYGRAHIHVHRLLYRRVHIHVHGQCIRHGMSIDTCTDMCMEHARRYAHSHRHRRVCGHVCRHVFWTCVLEAGELLMHAPTCTVVTGLQAMHPR